MKTYKRILKETERKLTGLEKSPSNQLLKIAEAIKLAEKGLEQLQERVQAIGFATPQAECYFFKTIKPVQESIYIYYKELLRIESKKPRACKKRERKFYRNRLKDYENYLQHNFEFYLYYKRGLSIFDEQYFLRGRKETQLYKGKIYYSQNPNFSTNRDGCLAIILAYERLIVLLQKKLSPKEVNGLNLSSNKLLWTARKVDLIELIYALHTAKVFNHGQADLKQIVTLLETSFQIDLGDVYRAFLEIRARKIDNTKFLNFLKDVLQQRMYEADE